MNFTKEEIDSAKEKISKYVEETGLKNASYRVIHMPDYLGNDRIEVSISWEPQGSLDADLNKVI
jgi:hypothetical protein